jgi:hypothetical protein
MSRGAGVDTGSSSPAYPTKRRTRHRRSKLKRWLAQGAPPYLWVYAIGVVMALLITYWLLRMQEQAPASTIESSNSSKETATRFVPRA